MSSININIDKSINMNFGNENVNAKQVSAISVSQINKSSGKEAAVVNDTLKLQNGDQLSFDPPRANGSTMVSHGFDATSKLDNIQDSSAAINHDKYTPELAAVASEINNKDIKAACSHFSAAVASMLIDGVPVDHSALLQEVSTLADKNVQSVKGEGNKSEVTGVETDSLKNEKGVQSAPITKSAAEIRTENKAKAALRHEEKMNALYARMNRAANSSYGDALADLLYFTMKVMSHNSAKRLTREYISELRDFKADFNKSAMNYKSAAVPNGFNINNPPTSGEALKEWQAFEAQYFADNGSVKDYGAKDTDVVNEFGLPNMIPGCSSFAELENRIEKFEDKLLTLGDDSQLANFDLQNALQRQQQLLEGMANASKSRHDTAMAIIKNL